MLIHSEISTNPISTQDDPLDELFGVQTNKNQLNSGPPKQLTRLIDGLKDEFCEKLKRQTPDAIKPKVKKAKKEKKDETTSTEGNDDDNSSTSSTSTSSSKSNGKIGGGSSGGGSNIEFEVVDDVVDVVVDDVVDVTGGGGGSAMGGGGGSASPVKPKKPIDVPGYRKALVLGSELQEKLGSLYTRVNAEQNYDDADYIALFNILQKIENKE
jgi:hypothetical protein